MKKVKIRILILAALLSVSYYSCQKDTISENSLENVTLIDECPLHLTYFVNENPTTVNLPNLKTLHYLIQKLDILAIEGYSISIHNQKSSSSDFAAKDVVKFETKNKKEFDEWLAKMLLDGYEIVWDYDKETGTFRGMAVK